MSNLARRHGLRERPLRDPFADRASLLSRVLLMNPGVEWTVRGLAEAAGVAPMLSSDVVRQLEGAGFVATRPEGRKLRCKLLNPQGLLDAWTTRYRWDRNAAIAVSPPMVDEERFLRRLPATLSGHQWALAMLAGAWRRIKYAPTDSLHLYVNCQSVSELRAIATKEGWPADPAGRVILMKPTYRTSVWFESSLAIGESGGGAQPDVPIPIVSDLQIIIDLWHYPERGRETAMQLWRPILRRFQSAGIEVNAP